MMPDPEPNTVLPIIDFADSVESCLEQQEYYINVDDEYTDVVRLQNQIFDLVRG